MWLKIDIITENKHVNKYTCSKWSIEAKRNSYFFYFMASPSQISTGFEKFGL